MQPSDTVPEDIAGKDYNLNEAGKAKERFGILMQKLKEMRGDKNYIA